MRIFGHEHHQNTDPWADAPMWAVELGAIGIIIIENQERLMASIDTLRTDIGVLIDTATQTITDAVAKAQAASNDPAIDALDQTVKAAIAKLATGAAAPAVAVPVTPPDTSPPQPAVPPTPST